MKTEVELYIKSGDKFVPVDKTDVKDRIAIAGAWWIQETLSKTDKEICNTLVNNRRESQLMGDKFRMSFHDFKRSFEFSFNFMSRIKANIQDELEDETTLSSI